MSSEADDFITHLTGFGLTEKEAHCYFYLLKYGPKTPSSLAKSLTTDREAYTAHASEPRQLQVVQRGPTSRFIAVEPFGEAGHEALS